MTPLQRRYIRGRIAGKSKYRAAIDAGYCHVTAMKVKHKIECCPAVRRALERWLDREGISDLKLQEMAGELSDS